MILVENRSCGQGTTTAAIRKYNQEHSGNPMKISYTKADFQQIMSHLNDGSLIIRFW